MAFTYIQIPSPRFGFQQITETCRIVDNAMGYGYFNDHIKEIKCGWVCFHADAIVAWAAVSKDKDIGILKCVVVDPLFRGQGIASKLTEIRLQYLKNCSIIYSYAWIRPNGYCASCKNLEKFGFEVVSEIPKYFANTKYKCPVCIKECNCLARKYKKEQKV